MNKMNAMIVAVAVSLVGSLSASEEVAKKEAACGSLSVEEQAFAAKLSEGHKKLFCLMSVEQRKAAIAAAVEAPNADQALDKVLKEKNVAAAAPVEAKSEKK